jgi:hypothetical protein
MPLLIQEDWTPEQALAVIELLDDLREVIWQRYQLPLQDSLREQRGTQAITDLEQIGKADPPF